MQEAKGVCATAAGDRLMHGHFLLLAGPRAVRSVASAALQVEAPASFPCSVMSAVEPSAASGGLLRASWTRVGYTAIPASEYSLAADYAAAQDDSWDEGCGLLPTTFSADPLTAVATYQKRMARELGAALTNSEAPCKRLLARAAHGTSGTIISAVLSPSFLLVKLETLENVAAAVAEGELHTYSAGGFTTSRPCWPMLPLTLAFKRPGNWRLEIQRLGIFVLACQR